MIRKLIKILGLAAVVLIVAAALYWQFNGSRLREEYAAFKKTAAPVLMYHAVGERDGVDWPGKMLISAQLFEEHLRYLQAHGYKMVSVEQLAERLQAGADVDKYVALTFDDGYKNNYSVVLPLLQKYHAKASFFVVNKAIGDPLHMDRDEIKSLIAAGMELGSHTTSHAPLSLIDKKYLAWELATSRYYLKTDFDRYIVRTLAYPNGHYNAEVIRAAEEYGFYRALTGKIGVNTAASFKAAPMEMYRINIPGDTDAAAFPKRLEEAYLCGFLQSKGLDVNAVRGILTR